MIDIRVGTGLDFHRLIENKERPLLLGGYLVPGEYALEGHSDADIIFHALADAIFGALGLGDIGMYFPDTDPNLKGMDSSEIIQAAVDAMEQKGYFISNVDITIIGERPKVGPHRWQIRDSVAAHLGVDSDQVGIKATTTEKMGALGRKEGIGCLATVLLLYQDMEEPGMSDYVESEFVDVEDDDG